MVFSGEYEVAVTSGGRIALPKKIRDILAGTEFVITKGFDTCLAGYNKTDWEVRSQNLMGVSLLDKEQIGKRRALFSSAMYLTIDEQGRVVIPKGLKEFVKLDGTAIIAGVGDHFEIWKKEAWNAYINSVINE